MENSKDIKCSNLQFPEDFLPWPLKELESVCFWLIFVRCVPLLWGLYWTSWAWSPCLPGYLPLPQHGHLGFSAVLSWLPAEKPGRPDSGLSPASRPDAWVSAGVRAAALGKAVPALPQGPRALLQPRWFQFEAFTRCWSWIEFLPWNQQDLLQHFAWIKIFVPFFFFTGQEEDSWSLRRKEIITGPYRSRSCATAAHSLRGRKQRTSNLEHNSFKMLVSSPRKTSFQGLSNNQPL